MGPNDAITINGISKTFTVGITNSKKEGLLSKFSKEHVSNKVLDNLSITIKKGEILGIIGRNGCGKSTLLSIIARILEPDSGEVHINGKVASILELGMGFHQDLSGRENIILKGEMYGFTSEEISKKMNEIIGYSELEKYIDYPIRTYSSGMIGRLAFSIMINVDADILLVDEVLSTGDLAFSLKAGEHFKKIAKSGKTVIFVSHNLNSLDELCTRAIWLEQGKIIKDGSVSQVLSQYKNSLLESLPIIMNLSDSGVPEYQYKLARIYYEGIKVPKDVQRYEELLESASARGYVPAQVEYARYLFTKDSIPIDKIEKLLIGPVNKGNSEAKLLLASCKVKNVGSSLDSILEAYESASSDDPILRYRFGEILLKSAITEDDKQKAFKIIEESANMGCPNAHHQLAIMYRDGVGVQRDLGNMERELLLASQYNYQPSINYLAELYYKGNLLSKNLAKSFELYEQSAHLGNVNSQFILANMFEEGLGTTLDSNKAVEWYSKYIDSQYSWYYVWIAEIARTSSNIKLSSEELYRKAIDSGNIYAAQQYLFYSKENLYSFGTPELIQKSINLIEKSDSLAKMVLADCYYRGILVDKDYFKAARLYEFCACQGDAVACYRLYHLYKNGLGVSKDPIKSRIFLKLASKRGNREAMIALIGEGIK